MPLDHDRLKSIFLSAVDAASPEKRAAFLDEACGTDLPLRKRVEQLLLAHDEAQQGARQQAPTRAESDDPPADGEGDFSLGPAKKKKPVATGVYAAQLLSQVVDGRYKLLEVLGEGGMGTVFLADEIGSVRRKVALKVIKAGMDSSQVLARFEAERQALAMMDHPYIAKVLHGGVTEQGRPYFVMEHVKGLPLAEFCDEHRLAIPQRLEIFLQICDAIQHAHQKGIAHRDIKPTNILVSMVNDKPVPKVIDFGLAKALHQPITQHSYHTARDMVVGTAQYMSPEQAGYQKLDIDTRTDIYSLGVVLYELLTGSPPLEKRRVKEVLWEEVARLIREEEPERPSTKISHSEQLVGVAARRRSEPLKLSKLVRGDLDWIVMKALAKERERRYPTANSFAADVRHYLHDEPVSAGPPTFRYRAGKYLRRHRGQVAAVTVMLVLLITGTITTTWGWARAVHESKRANDAAVVAQAQLDFLCNDILNQADPGEQIKPERAFEKHIKLVEVLNRAAERVGKRFADQPPVEAALRFTLGRTYYGLGEFQKSREHLERSEQLRRQYLGETDPLRLDALNELGWTYAALDLLEAEATLKTVLALREKVLGLNHPDTLKTRCALVLWDVDNNRLDKADTRLQDILQAQQTVLPPLHRDILNTQRLLADTYESQERHDEAEKLYLQTLEQTRVALGREHPDTLTAWNNLGLVYLNRSEALKKKGEREKARQDALRAEALFEELTKTSERVLGMDHTSHLKNLQNLAAAHEALGKFPEALAITRRVLERHEAVLGKTHEDTIIILAGLAAILANSGKFQEAEPVILDVWQRAEGKKLPADKMEALFDSTIVLYRKLGNQAKANEWQGKLAAWKASNPK